MFTSTKIMALTLVALLFALLTVPANAQSALGPKDFGFAYAVDYGKWSVQSSDSIAAGAAVVTISGNAHGAVVTPGGRTFYPIATNVPLHIEAAGGTAEDVTPSAVSCSQNGTTCTFSATFTYLHNGKFRISSATYGICEAKADILTVATGGTVVIANGFGGSTSTITSSTLAGACDATTVNLLDVRAGVFQFYTSNGSVYAASTSPFNATAYDATAVAATGTNFIGVGQDQTTNHAFGNASIGADADGASYDCLKTRSANADARSTTTIVTGDDLCAIRAFGADGANYIETAGILFDSTGTIGSTRVPSVIKFYTGTDAAPTVKTLALTLNADQTATFAGAISGTSLTMSSLTSGRVVIASTAGLLSNDSDLTFATDTLTATKIVGSTSISTPSLFNTSGALALTTVTSGNITLNPIAAATAAVTTAARFETAAGASINLDGAACTSGDCTLGGDGNYFALTGTTAVDGFATAGWQAGSIIVVSTAGSVTFNNSGTVAGGFAALKLVGAANVSMTALDMMILMYDGTSWMQIAPTLVK